MFDPRTRDISLWNRSLLGAGKQGGYSLESQVSNWQLAWWEQKTAQIKISLREAELSGGAWWTTPLYLGDLFLWKEQDNSLIIRTPPLCRVLEKNSRFFLRNSLFFSRLHRSLSTLLTSSSFILAYVIDCCLFPNNIKGGTSMTPLKWSKNSVWGLIWPSENYIKYSFQWEIRTGSKPEECVTVYNIDTPLHQPRMEEAVGIKIRKKTGCVKELLTDFFKSYIHKTP